jgi:zinc protease
VRAELDALLGGALLLRPRQRSLSGEYPLDGRVSGTTMRSPEGQRTIRLSFRGEPAKPALKVEDFRHELLLQLLELITGADYEVTPEGNTSLSFTVEGASPAALLSAFEKKLAELKSLRDEGLGEAGLATAKERLLSRLEAAAAGERSAEELLALLQDQVNLGTSATDALWAFGAAEALLPGILAKDINAVLAGFFMANDLSFVIGGPDAEPTVATVSALIQKAYTIVPPLTALLGSPPVPGTIAATRSSTDPAATIYTLGNGATVLLQPTVGSSELALYALARGGYSGATAATSVSWRMAAEVYNYCGMGGETWDRVQEFLQGKALSLSFKVEDFQRSFSGTSSRAEVETLFQMLYLRFTDIHIDSEMEAWVLEQFGKSLKESDPQMVWSNQIQRTIYGNDARFNPLTDADLSRYNRAQALSFLRAALNPADYIFVFTGAIDTTRMRSLISTYLASIPAAASRWNTLATASAVTAPALPGSRVSTNYSSGLTQVYTYMGYIINEPFDLAYSAVASVLAEYLRLKLDSGLRSRNLVSTLGVNLSASLSGRIALEIRFSANRNQVAQAEAAIQAALNEAASGVFDQALLARAISQAETTCRTILRNNSWLARSYAEYQALAGLPFSRVLSLPSLYSQITPADLHYLSTKLLTAGLTRVTLNPR